MPFFRRESSRWNTRRPNNGARSLLRAKTSAPARSGRRTAAVALALAALIGLAWAARAAWDRAAEALFFRNDRFTVRKIAISTTGTLTESHFREYAGISEGQNLFQIDIDHVARAIAKTPRVRSVQVRRILPDTLSIEVEERKPIARVAEGAGGLPTGVDREGVVLGPNFGRGLPIISGLQEKGLAPGSIIREPAVLDALHLLESVEQMKLGALVNIQAVGVSHPDYLDVALASGARVQLGRDRIAWRLERLADLITSHRELGSELEFADLTVDRNFPARARSFLDVKGR